MATSPGQMSSGSEYSSVSPGVNGQVSPSSRDMSEVETPGFVSFAGIMMLVLGGFQLTWAFVEFANAAWITSATYGNFGGHLWLWAILDTLFALAAFYAGYSIFTGGRFGQVFGLTVAGISAVRWFFYISAAPWAGIVMIALAVLIIYGLVSNEAHFNGSNRAV